MYWVGAGEGTGVAGISRGPILLGVGVFSLELAGCSGLLELTVLSRTFFR